MVEVFRPREELPGLARQVVEVKAKTLWVQIGVYDDGAAAVTEATRLRGFLALPDAELLCWSRLDTSVVLALALRRSQPRQLRGRDARGL